MVPKIKNTTALILLGAAITFILTGAISMVLNPENYATANLILYIGLNGGQLIGLVLLINNGTLMKTIYGRIISFGIGILIIGVLFKIMHWPGYPLILLIAVLLIVTTYSVRFLKKKEKKRLDILKFLWVIIGYSITIMILQHWISDEYSIVAQILFWLALTDFVITGLRDKTLLDKNY